jgi:MarR family 2-MHQ and catechol resistance regulon transcriptional repressor
MPTHYRGRPDEVAALDAYIKLMRAADSVTARLEPVMASAGLTLGQFGTLEALLHLGPLCQRDLGRKLLRSDGNITVVVNNLAHRGLVRRVRRRDDRRFITVSLSAKGRRLIESLFPGHVALVVREMEPLSRREQAELGRLCRLVGRRLPGGMGGPQLRGPHLQRSGGKEMSNGAGRDTLRVARAL